MQLPFPEVQRSALALSRVPVRLFRYMKYRPPVTSPAHLITSQSNLADALNVENEVSKQAKQIHILIAGAIKFLFL